MVSATLKILPLAERRIATRRQPTLGTICFLAANSGEELGTGLVWNLSSTGVSMLLHQRLQPGTTVRAELRTDKELFTLSLPLRVAHVAGLQTGDFVLGGQFLRHLEPEEIRHFIA